MKGLESEDMECTFLVREKGEGGLGDDLQKRRSECGKCFSSVGVWEESCCGGTCVIQGGTALS